ncbi:MAG: putative oxidoreductase, partial [Planctomycetota bacterium]
MIGRQKTPIIDRRIRIGVVGCGRISKNHFNAIADLSEDLELVGACDNDPARLSQDFIPAGTPHYDLLPEMLEHAAPDVVAVCTPSGMHPRQTVETAEAGVHVMTEKPMATRWKDGLRMVEACDRAGVHLLVVKQNRFNATLQLLRRAIAEGRFGRIYMANVNVFWTRPQAYYDTDRWRGTWELDGGAFMNQASHYIDLLDWLIGPIASVQAMTGTL